MKSQVEESRIEVKAQLDNGASDARQLTTNRRRVLT